MRTLSLLVLLAALPTAAFGCKCATWTVDEIVARYPRIALVEVVDLGPAFNGVSPIPHRTARNRKVQVRVVEAFVGKWAQEETLEEAAEFALSCDILHAPGDKFIVLLAAGQTYIDGCAVRAPQPALLESLRARRKGA